jgi:hypothetical protein
MQTKHKMWWGGVLCVLLAVAGLSVVGCHNTPFDLEQGPAPLRLPPPDKHCDGSCYEDSLMGGQVFSMYCAACHDARPLAERPFSNYKNVALHMRVRANMTGKEYAKLMVFLRRWNDIPLPSPETPSSPKKLIFSQPIQELRPTEQPEEAPPPKKVEPPK